MEAKKINEFNITFEAGKAYRFVYEAGTSFDWMIGPDGGAIVCSFGDCYTTSHNLFNKPVDEFVKNHFDFWNDITDIHEISVEDFKTSLRKSIKRGVDEPLGLGIKISFKKSL